MRVLLGLVVASLALLASSRAFVACGDDAGCKDDYDCEQAFVCKVKTGACEPFVCKEASDCGSGLSCEDNECK